MPAPDDRATTLRAWRAAGAQQLDPVRFALVNGMVRRAEACSGPARERLHQRIGELMDAYAAERAGSGLPASSPSMPAPRTGIDGKTLTELTAQLNAQAASRRHAAAGSTRPAAPLAADAAAAQPHALPALEAVRATWARIQADQRLERSMQEAPANAGPLNSQQLVLRALLLMRSVSPGYLQRFMGYVDALRAGPGL